MGTANLPERDLLQGVIRLAAAYVHRARGNPAGLAKNLRGALARIEAGRPAGAQLGMDAEALATDVASRLAAAEDDLEGVAQTGPPAITRTGEPAIGPTSEPAGDDGGEG